MLNISKLKAKIGISSPLISILLSAFMLSGCIISDDRECTWYTPCEPICQQVCEYRGGVHYCWDECWTQCFEPIYECTYVLHQ